MFGGAKPTFGAAQPSTGFGFGSTATSSPFGQSAFGKPATSAFGAAPAFGTQQQTTSLFGSTATPQSTGLFGGATTSTAFGATTQAAPAFGGGFAQPQQQNTSIFGSAQPAANTNSLFGQPSTSAFGSAVKPGLGGFGQTATQPTSSLFGQPAAATSTTGFGTFGQAAPTTSNVFGSAQTSAFGQPAGVAGTNTGTSIAKYQATIGTDTLMKNGTANTINTKQHCITAMKEYEAKSLEELRMEDYLANRKGAQAGTSAAGGFFGASTAGAAGGTSLFGAAQTAAQTSGGLFGQQPAAGTENKSLFGTSAFGQPATSAFGAAQPAQNSFMAKPFGAPATSAFGQPAATDGSANPFGQKPAFGQQPTTGLFGQTPAASTPSAFGQPSTGFGGFGSTAGTQQPTSLFGAPPADANKPTFGLGGTSTAATGFGGFGATPTSTAGAGGLFGTKPATGFGTAPAFGATSTAATGFGNFSLNNTQAGGGLFNSSLQKPATSGFGGFGTATSQAAPLSFNAGTGGSSLFGNNAAKPSGMFGGGLNTGTTGATVGLFGNNTSAFGQSASLGGSGFGTGTLGGGGLTLGGLSGTPQQLQPVPIHQQILSKVTSPYGDNPIFKDLKRNEENDPNKATNPSAQKALLENNSKSSANQYSIAVNPSPSAIRVKPITGALTKKALFEGLEEFDSSVESFTLKPNAKRLILKPKANTSIIGSAGAGSQSGTPNTSLVAGVGTPQRSKNDENIAPENDIRNESFSGQIPADAAQNAVAAKDLDASRRESWLHPNNLEKVRQHNLNAGLDGGAPLNSSLSELVPRKPLDTFRNAAGSSTPITTVNAGQQQAARLSVSTIPENPFEDQSSSISRRQKVTFADDNANESLYSTRGDERSLGAAESNASGIDLAAGGTLEPAHEEHPTRIVLRRIGYYTIPSLDDLKSYLAEDGTCVVPNFTVGREGYGNVYFGKELDVAGLNLDEIVHFRNKEVIIYPDDDNKPPIGQGLNREAQVTLDQVWPHDKTKHEPIKDAERLAEMDWEGKLRRVCDKNDTRFIEYRPETGSWVFRVKHFSKYGLNDSDEEDDNVPTDPKKAKIGVSGAAAAGAIGKTNAGATNLNDQQTLAAMKNAQKLAEEAARNLDPKAAFGNSFYPMDETTEFMYMDKTQFFQNNGNTDFSMFDQNRSIISPTAELAKQAGTDSHKLQLMKASFFAGDDDDKSVASDLDHFHDYNRNYNHGRLSEAFGFRTRDMLDSAMWKDDVGRGISNSESSSQMDYGFNASPHMQGSSSGSMLSMVREEQSEYSTPAAGSAITALDTVVSAKLPQFMIRPKVALCREIAVQLPYAKSLSFSLQGKWACDLGLYNSRLFKLGFGPQNTLIVPSTRHNLYRDIKDLHLHEASRHIFKLRSANDVSASIMQHVKISSVQHYSHFKESIADHLEIQLRNSLQQEVEGSECPWIKSDAGADLIVRHLDEAIKQINLGNLEEYAVSVWSLCLALWGEHEELEGREASSHFTVMCRRNLLSEWLENTLTDKDLLTKTVSKHSYLDHLLEMIMCHKVTEACELAFSYDDANLSLLLAQLSSGPSVRQLMEDQLAEWHKNEADKFIHIERLKLYMLVAGVALMNSSQGPINTLDGLDWIKVLALQLWYLSSPTASITDSLLAYEKSFRSEEFYSLPPTPSYVDNLNRNESLYDLRYHLLQLYSKRSHSLESILNPATHTADPMDYRLSWLLLQTLEALGYRHMSALSESQLHVGFASQLENNDMWEWSIFVLLHIKNRNQREIAVQNLLYRYVSVSKDVALSEKEKFVINNLGVPEKWIDYAKAVKAGAVGNHHLQAKYLLKAKQWSLAHEVIFQHIAPDAVINDNLDYLHQLLSQFESPELQKGVKVPNWSNQGQIFLDFIDINEKFKSLKTLKTEADIETRWENLKPQLADLCSRINLLPCPTPKHRLCQSEIAQNLACLVRGVLLVCPVLNPCLIIKIALERLPLPQEFAQQELRALLDSLVNDLSKANMAISSKGLTLKT